MKKTFLFLFSLCLLAACTQQDNNLIVQGKVKGLKKGTLYLQTIQDSSLATLDSVVINGQESFLLETNISSPQVMYLYLKKVDNNEYNDRIRFFAEPGELAINTTLDKFVIDATVTGSKNHEKLVKYQEMMDKFNSQRLELIKANLLARQKQNKAAIDSTQKLDENLLKRRYLYTINFALNNKDLEVAPYLAVSEVYDANIKYLDTLYNALAPSVQGSKHGKSLKELLEKRRESATE